MFAPRGKTADAIEAMTHDVDKLRAFRRNIIHRSAAVGEINVVAGIQLESTWNSI